MAPSSKPWADGPFELLSARAVGAERGKEGKGSAWIVQDMILVHNIIIRMMNTIYLQCLNVHSRGTEKDQADFVDYALCWATVVTEHHTHEETLFFDQIEELAEAPGIMQANKEQHGLFHDGLEQYETYLKSVQGGVEKYDGAKLKAIIDAFMPTLTMHLHAEIETLQGLSKYEDKCEWDKWSKSQVEKILGKALESPLWKTIAIPTTLCSHDRTFEDYVYDGWPPFPWYISLLFRLWYFRTYSNLWRFGACTAWGNPQELPFADDKPHEG